MVLRVLGLHPPKALPLGEERVFNLHIQWFAAEDEGRTEDPTEQKLKKAREEGKIAKSSDLVSAIVLLFPLLLLAFLGPYYLQTMVDMIRYFLTVSFELDIVSSGGLVVQSFVTFFTRLAFPLLGATFFAALVANILQVGFLFTTKPIQPDLSKISPNVFKWAQRVFFSSEGAFNLLKSIFKVGVIVFLAFWNVRREIPRMTNLVYATTLEALALVASLAFRIMVQTAVLLVVVSLPDYFFQRYKHRESLRMTRHETKEEMKQSEGDPLIKSRLRQKMREILNNKMMQSVPEADVIITNPTHYAVALEYRQESMTAPQVIAKGLDEVAQRIRRVAKENNVPIVENKPLARALYANVEIGDEIPEEYYAVVSNILVKIYEVSGKMAAG